MGPNRNGGKYETDLRNIELEMGAFGNWMCYPWLDVLARLDDLGIFKI